MGSELNKPISLLREDLINSLTDIINESGVSFLIVEPILRDILQQVQKINMKQLETDRANWAKQTTELEDNNDG